MKAGEIADLAAGKSATTALDLPARNNAACYNQAVAADVFIAQHRGPDGPGRRRNLGYFASLDEAKQALEERWEPRSWQGIRREVTGERWWRDSHTHDWVGPRRSVYA